MRTLGLALLLSLLTLAVVLLAGAPRGHAEARPESPEVEDSLNRPRLSSSNHDIRPLDRARVEELAAGLSPEAWRVTQRAGTEPAFCGLFHDHHTEGVYACAVCGLPLFRAEEKFDSGTGWPSFFKAFDQDHLSSIVDDSHLMRRTEVRCARCDAHLGHVFSDGPAPSGERYCINSASLEFFEEGAELPARSQPVPVEHAWFAGGCFWGVEDHFQKLPGVIDVESGYAGGSSESPTYKQVCTGTTGHAETVHVSFDTRRTSYQALVDTFFQIHNPTTLNRQGPDRGTQYRSAIFTSGPEQARIAKETIRRLSEGRPSAWPPIVTQVEPLRSFHRAEEYHQDYHENHGGSCPLPGAW